MGVGVDQSGRHDLAGDIDNLPSAGRQNVCLNRGNLAVRMATSLMPSMPDAGSMTRAPRRSRSKVVLTDMLDLLSRSLARSRCLLNAKYTSYFIH